MSPVLCLALSALLWPRTLLAALPPASVGSSTPVPEPVTQAAPATVAPLLPDGDGSWWDDPWIVSPRIGWYGYLGYQWDKNSYDADETSHRGLIGRLGGRFSSFLWQPWFGQLTGDLRLNMARDSTVLVDDERFRSQGSKNMILTGNAKVSVLQRSRIPFSAYFERNYNRVSVDGQPLAGGYLGQRLGFSQGYTHTNGANGTFGWDHGTQGGGGSTGKTSQDSLQLNMAHRVDAHELSMSGNRSVTSQKGLGQSTQQNNLSGSHRFTATESDFSVDTTANISQGSARMNPGQNDNRVMQISSVAYWRPEEEPLTVSGSVRALGLSADNTSYANSVPVHASARMNNFSMSLGMSYVLSPESIANASLTTNVTTVNGERMVIHNQMAGISYSPEGKEIAGFQYRWTASASAANQTGGLEGSASRLSLQLSHNLNRQFQLDNDSVIAVDASQALASSLQSVRSQANDIGAPQPGNHQLTHTAGISWSSSESGGNATARLSVSDSRAIGGAPQYFQMINLQLSGNIVLSGASSLNGNLTIQGVRQNASDPRLAQLGLVQEKGFKTTSNGSISYRNQRLFGVRQLMLTSSLRMNSQALLPMLGGPLDQEMAAWDTSLDYLIGRLTFRVNTLIAQTTAPRPIITANGVQQMEGQTQVNKSIMFTVTRSFGP